MYKTVTVRVGEIEVPVAVRIRPGGDLIFFIHGLGCTMESFAGAWDQSALAAYALLAPDLPGFGDTPRPDGIVLTIEFHAAVCRALISLLPGTPVHLVCHSMGGAVGLVLSGFIRDRLASFINVEGNLIGTDSGVSRRVAKVRKELYLSVLRTEIIQTARTAKNPGARRWADWIEQADPQAFRESGTSLVEWSESGKLLPMFEALPCGKVYIHGEQNARMRIVSRLGAIPVVSIPGSGHFPMIDNSVDFYRAVAVFLSR